MGEEFAVLLVIVVLAVGFGVVLFVLAGVAMRIVFRSRAQTLALSGRTECGMNVAHGSIPRVPRGWRSGTAELGPAGWFTFHPYYGGMRALPGPPVRFQVTGVVDAVPRPPGWRRALRVMWFTRIIVLQTPTATIELAVERDSGPWILGVLFAPAPAAAPVPGLPGAAVPGPAPAAAQGPPMGPSSAHGAPERPAPEGFARPS